MFTKKTQAEIDAMTPEDAQKYFEQKESFEKAEAAKATKEAIEKALEPLTKSNADLSEQLANLKEKSTKSVETPFDTLKSEIEENKETLKAIAQKVSGSEITLKALTNRAAIVGNAQATELSDVGQLATRKLSLYDVFPKVQLGESNNNGTVRYYDWDSATTVRAAAARAEGATFPESTAKFATYSLPLEKIGDTLPVTEEFFEDEAMFASELNLFLDTNVSLEMDRQLANGTGASNEIKGLYASIDAYVPAGAAITDPNIYDLAVKVIEDIVTTGGSKYMPNVLIARRSVINAMKLKKDSQNNYMLPPFVSQNGMNIDGLTVIESNICPANTLVIGDSRFGKIYEKGGIVLSKGEINAQFVEDAMTLKARKRMLFLIRNADKGGFRKVTDIAAALAILDDAISV